MRMCLRFPCWDRIPAWIFMCLCCQNPSGPAPWRNQHQSIDQFRSLTIQFSAGNLLSRVYRVGYRVVPDKLLSCCYLVCIGCLASLLRLDHDAHFWLSQIGSKWTVCDGLKITCDGLKITCLGRGMFPVCCLCCACVVLALWCACVACVVLVLLVLCLCYDQRIFV
jgi:hypothetical protein